MSLPKMPHLPYAAGVPSIGSELMQYIPVLYAGKTIKRYYENSILPFISNTDYEGMIRKQGSEVRIRSVPEIAIEDHAIGDVITNQRPITQSQTLLIDKAKRWSFIIEDIEQVQTDLKNRVSEWSQNAAENLDAHIITEVLEDVPSQVGTGNFGATAGIRSGQIDLGTDTTGGQIDLTQVNIMEKIVQLGATLDEQNAPDEGRWLLIDPLTAALLKSSDIKDASLSGDGKSPFRSGLVGRLDRFTVFQTNRLSTQMTTGGTPVKTTNMLFGNNEALTFATQLTKNKIQDDPNGFDMIYRGLQVYGYKVVKPEAIGVLKARPTFTTA